MKIKFETECWRPLVLDAAYRAGLPDEALDDATVDALADDLCRAVLSRLFAAGIDYQRAYGQRIGAEVILQTPDHPAAGRFGEICDEEAAQIIRQHSEAAGKMEI